MKFSLAVNFLGLGSIAVTKADFNGLRRLGNSNNTRNLRDSGDIETRKLQSTELKTIGNNGSPASVFPLSECRGDCDDDGDCAGTLVCYQRYQAETVPGCSGSGVWKEDYCAYRTDNYLFYVGGDNGPGGLGLCEGDCNSDIDCAGDLICQQRRGTTPVPGCAGTGRRGTDYCRYPDPSGPMKPPTLKPSNSPTKSPTPQPTNAPVPRPTNQPTSQPTPNPTQPGQNPTPPPTTANPTTSPIKNPTPPPTTANPTTSPSTRLPTTSPTKNPTPPPTTRLPTNTVDPTYVPGELTVPCDQLLLSTGMACKRLTVKGQKVQLANGSVSNEGMHYNADGAGVIAHPSDGGWYYVSNSESNSGNGGVGALRFDASGDVIGYEKVLTGTSRNCGGGVTYWNTWVSCEENGDSGYCYEVDPYTGYTSLTNVVPQGGAYESFAYDNKDPTATRFFVTEDRSKGALVRYTPHPNAYASGDPYDRLKTANGLHEFLVLDSTGMTFTWTTDITEGENNAERYFQNAEGIDVHNRILNFVSKDEKKLFTLDLEAQTYTATSTLSGLFDIEPDQIGRIVGDADALYFCEDGKNTDSDIHGRDTSGKFFTVVKNQGIDDESTGLAFSPDGMFMYVAYQDDSKVFAFWRTDGLPFNGAVADTKYH